VRVRARAHRAAGAPRERLERAAGVHVRDDGELVAVTRDSCSAAGRTIQSLASISIVQPAFGFVIHTRLVVRASVAIVSAMKCTADSTITFFSGLRAACSASW
jgi:hypothetical protein